MTAPAMAEGTWPVNSATRLYWELIQDSATPPSPLTSATMTFQMYDAAGATVGSPANGSHLGAGAWELLIPPLGLTEGLKYRAKVTIDGPGLDDHELEWWPLAVREKPRF